MRQQNWLGDSFNQKLLCGVELFLRRGKDLSVLQSCLVAIVATIRKVHFECHRSWAENHSLQADASFAITLRLATSRVQPARSDRYLWSAKTVLDPIELQPKLHALAKLVHDQPNIV